MPLPNDVCRCRGELLEDTICERRDTCARYADKGTGDHVPQAGHLCEWRADKEFKDYYIPAGGK